MRVTTQMLNEASRKAGLPVNRTSLINYVNGSNSGTSLASALSKTDKGKKVDVDAKKKEYKELENSADYAKKSADEAISKGSDKLTLADVSALADNFNEMLERLQDTTDTINKFYNETAKDTVDEYSELLWNMGITVKSDGSLSVDKSKFNEDGSLRTEDSQAGDLNQIFNQAGGFLSKISFLASRVSDNANAQAESVASRYNAAGSMSDSSVASYFAGRYDFRG